MKHHHPIQISIPQPCHEDWNKMTPQEQGRFCDSCQKCVVDFTGFTDKELHQYFIKHSGEKVCGRFQNWQLQRIVTLPPEPRSRFYKWFISLGFVFFLAELLGTEAKAQETIKNEVNANKTDDCKGCIDGIIMNHKDAPISNVKIILKCAGMITGETHSDKYGKYSFLDTPAGRYELEIKHQNASPGNVHGILVNSNTRKTINFLIKNGKIKQRDTDITEYKTPWHDNMNTTVITGQTQIELMQPSGKHSIDSIMNNFKPVPAKQRK